MAEEHTAQHLPHEISCVTEQQGGASARLCEVKKSLAGTLLPPPTNRLSAY